MANIIIIVVTVIFNTIVIPAAPFCSTNSVNFPTQSKMVPARSLPTTSRRPQSPSHPSAIPRSRASAFPTHPLPAGEMEIQMLLQAPSRQPALSLLRTGKRMGIFLGRLAEPKWYHSRHTRSWGAWPIPRGSTSALVPERIWPEQEAGLGLPD